MRLIQVSTRKSGKKSELRGFLHLIHGFRVNSRFSRFRTPHFILLSSDAKIILGRSEHFTSMTHDPDLSYDTINIMIGHQVVLQYQNLKDFLKVYLCRQKKFAARARFIDRIFRI